MPSKLKHYISLIFGSPAFLALIPAIGVILLLPLNFQKYNFSEVTPKMLKAMNFYHDMDHDGFSEQLSLRYNGTIGSHNGSIYFYDVPFTSKFIDQINTNMRFVETAKPFFLDFDQDNYDEMFFFMKKDSSLYLKGFEYNPDNSDQVIFVSKFLDYVYMRGDMNDFQVINGPVIDLNGDGFDELTFIVKGMFCGMPRRFFIYDIYADSLISSTNVGMSFYKPLQYAICDDGQKVVFSCFTGATNNTGEDVLYSDSSAWAYLIDENAEFCFCPEPNKPKYFYSNYNLPFSNDTLCGLISLFQTADGTDEPQKLVVYDQYGEVINSKWFNNDEIGIFYPERRVKDEFYLYNVPHRELSLLDIDFNVLSQKKINLFSKNIFLEQDYYSLDITGDSICEIIFSDPFGGILITNLFFDEQFYFDYAKNDRIVHMQTVFLKDYLHPLLVLTDGNRQRVFSFDRNNLYYLKYPVWIAVYLAFLGLFYLSFYYQRRVINRRHEERQQLYHNQMLAIKKQIDPHFTLNSINNISSMFLAGDVDKAQNYLTRLSRIMYRGLMDSENLMNTLGDELDYINDYLVIQKYRFNDLFDYKIDVSDENLRDLFIPGHVVYSFVENALQHGLRPKGKEGVLVVSAVVTPEGKLQVSVEDNGIGRNEAKRQGHRNTGKGTKIAARILDLFSKVTNVPVELEYIDLVDENGIAKGTTVLMTMEKVTEKKA